MTKTILLIACLVFSVNSFSQTIPVAPPDNNGIFTKVDIEASFPGGDKGWVQYLQQNLDAYTPIKHHARAGKYQVIIKFVVSKNGSISDVEAETNLGYGMEEEAIRVIKNGPKWNPGMQNGRYVNSYRQQPITFLVEER
jgi:protein TonB